MFFNINQIIYTNLNTYDLNFVSSGFKFGVSSDNKQDDNNDLDKKIKFFENEISFFKKKLENKNFVKKAPQKVVNENKAKLKDALKNLELLKK